MNAASDNSNEMRELLINVLLPNSMVEPTYPWEISQFLGNHYVAYVAGGESASEAIAAAEKEINSYIRSNDVEGTRFN